MCFHGNFVINLSAFNNLRSGQPTIACLFLQPYYTPFSMPATHGAIH